MTRVRRVHVPGAVGGESTEYWEHAWASIDRVEAAAAIAVSPPPVLRLLQRFVPDRGTIVELGAGSARWLAPFRSPDRHLIGVDLTSEALAASKKAWPELGYVESNIRRLGLRDASMDCVISLGVVEHFEDGPEQALAEHRRILAPNGIGLISAPFINLTRLVKDRWHLDVRRRPNYRARGRLVTNIAAPAVGPGPGAFHQYEFSTREWRRLLDDAGFRVLELHRHDVATGIGEISIPRPGRRAASSSTTAHSVESVAEVDVTGVDVTGVDLEVSPPRSVSSQPRRGDSIRRIVIAEQPDNRMEQLVCTVGQSVLAHLCLAVVTPK